MEERTKEVEEFYKSESDSDDDNKENVDNSNVDNSSLEHCEKRETNTEKSVDVTTQQTDTTVNQTELAETNNIEQNTNATDQEEQQTEIEIPAGTVASAENEKQSEDCDGVENVTEKQQQHLNDLIEKYTNDTQIIEIEQKTKSKMALLQEKLIKNKPKLSGNPCDVIDLDDGVVRKSEIANLIERFMKHAQPQHTTKNNEIQIR